MLQLVLITTNMSDTTLISPIESSGQGTLTVSKLQGVMDNYCVNCYHSFPNCKRSKRLSDIYSLVKEVIMDASKVTDRS